MATDAPRERIGPYRLEGRIGQGSVAEVMRARDARSGEPVALKLLTTERGLDTDTRQRFLREAEAARRLVHPGIVAVREVGEDAGIAYIAMALVDGGDLAKHTRAPNLLALGQVLEIGAQAAQALAFAHRSGVIHRDVKPANLLRDGASGTVLLTDFGVARLADVAGGVTPTRSGLLLGTIAYMSPEQLAGAPVDAASDLYALGATLFHLLTGRLPHEADTMSQQMHAIANLPAPDLRTLRPDLGAPLAGLLARLLAKTAAQRGGDGDALAAQLRAIAMGISGALPAGSPESPADPRHNSRQ